MIKFQKHLIKKLLDSVKKKSFRVFLAYGGSLWLNFYAAEFTDFATAYAVLITFIGVIFMGLLTSWVVCEVYYMNADDPRFEIRRKTQTDSIEIPEVPNMLVAIAKYSEKHSV